MSPEILHDPIVKGKGDEAFLVCPGCLYMAEGPRWWCNRLARLHRASMANTELSREVRA